MGKICFFCGRNDVIKKGLKNGKQRWFCKACGKFFSSRKRADKKGMVELYTQGNYTVRQLASLFGFSERTVYRSLQRYSNNSSARPVQKDIVLLIGAGISASSPSRTTFRELSFGINSLVEKNESAIMLKESEPLSNKVSRYAGS